MFKAVNLPVLIIWCLVVLHSLWLKTVWYFLVLQWQSYWSFMMEICHHGILFLFWQGICHENTKQCMQLFMQGMT